MKSFPMFLRMNGRRLIIVGGGEQATQKARLALKTEAEIVLVTPTPDAELRTFIDEGRVTRLADADVSTFRDTALVFIATGCPGADAAWHGVAKAAGAVVNVVDAPDLCDAITPSIVDRDPVVVAIGTEGNAPVLGRQIKARIEELLEPGLGRLASYAGAKRDAVARQVPRRDRRNFWRWVFGEAPRRLHASGDETAAERMIEDAIRARGAPCHAGSGLITAIGGATGPGDLLTLRAVQRLQEADLIFYPADADASVLELARRDAERVALGGKDTPDWPMNRVLARVRAESETTSRIVWLMRGDTVQALDQIAADTSDIETIPTAPAGRAVSFQLTG